ncbi:putative gibberellin 20-oxidase [Aspergillus flavus AF70]|nr:putative gibberellin 20-oxidase [Aspergillus flavus AF70]
MLTRSEVSKHQSRDRCLVIIKGNVYDLTSYLDSMELSACTRPCSRVQRGHPTRSSTTRTSLSERTTDKKVLSLLRSVVNIHDFEHAASQVLAPRSFAFFKPGANDEYTAQWNQDSWKHISFCP